jgi:hypothetical protein
MEKQNPWKEVGNSPFCPVFYTRDAPGEPAEPFANRIVTGSEDARLKV